MENLSCKVIRLRVNSGGSLRGRQLDAAEPMPSEDAADNEAEVAVDLVRRIGDGDRAAEDELVARYQDRLRYVLLRQLPNHQDLEDVLQSTLMMTIVRLREGGIAEPEKLGGFIYGVLNNLKKAQIRDNMKRQGESDAELLDRICDSLPGPQQLSLSQETTQIVRRLIDELDEPRDRELLLLLYVDQEEKTVVCEALNISPDHLRRVLYRAKRRLKTLMLEAKDGRDLRLIADEGA